MTKSFNVTELLSDRAKNRVVPEFLSTTEVPPDGYKTHEDTINLSWGTPNPGFFPVDTIDIKTLDYPFQKTLNLPITNASLESLGTTLNGSTDALQNPLQQNTIDSLRRLNVGESRTKTVVSIERHTDTKGLIDIDRGLQYSMANGMEPLLKFVEDYTEYTNKPAYGEWSTILSQGSLEGADRVFNSIVNPGDIILCEEFTFTPINISMREYGAIIVPIKLKISSEGSTVDYEYMEELLENWDELMPEYKGKKPKAFYTIPNGQNPIGFSQSLELRKKIYGLAEKYEFFIIEDDPYFSLTLPQFKKPEGFMALHDFISVEEYVKDHLCPSYLRIDSKGLVIRLETFSKMFAPGLRLGFIIAHNDVMKAIKEYSVAKGFPSGFSQLILNNVLQQKFASIQGWIQWILKIRVAYAHRRDVLYNTLLESSAFSKGYIDLIDPKAGMFMVIKINYPEGTDVVAKNSLLNWKIKAYGANVVPGINLAVDHDFSGKRSNFFRVCIGSTPDSQTLEIVGERISAAIEEFFTNGLEF